MNPIKRVIDALDEQTVRQAFANAHCRSAVAQALGLRRNASQVKQILDGLIRRYHVDTTHFDRNLKQRKYQVVTKQCPVCHNTFETRVGAKGEKHTCSRACANTFFRSGENNGNYKDDADAVYQTVCWRHHERKCVVCGEMLIVEAHHHNGVHDDNRPENFVPLCPTHHQYWHSKHRYLIQAQVDAYMKSC